MQQAMYNEKPPDDGHRHNILNEVYVDVGIDVVSDSVHGKVWLVTAGPEEPTQSSAADAAKPADSATALLRAGRCTRAIPAKINAPPRSCIGPGRCPSSTKAKITAKITSVNDTNDASELPRRRTATMPDGYASTALTKINNRAGSHQPTAWSAKITTPPEAASGRMPAAAAVKRTAAPMPVPAVVSSSG